MKDGEPCTSRGVSTVLEGVMPRPLIKVSMAWRFLPYELYTMMRYLQYFTLQRQGLSHFDCWASTFGETVTAIELAPEGTGYRARTRFAKFFNLPELMTLFKEVADIKTSDQLDLRIPKANYHTVVVPPTEHQKDMVQELSKRAAIVHANKVDPSVDNMLKITSDGRKLGLDQRIVNPLLPDDPQSKVNACVNNILSIWRDSLKDGRYKYAVDQYIRKNLLLVIKPIGGFQFYLISCSNSSNSLVLKNSPRVIPKPSQSFLIFTIPGFWLSPFSMLFTVP